MRASYVHPTCVQELLSNYDSINQSAICVQICKKEIKNFPSHLIQDWQLIAGVSKDFIVVGK